MKPYFTILAEYNADMNRKLCQVLQEMPKKELMADKKAFFGSIYGTANHIMVGDLMWLKRFRKFKRHFDALSELKKFPKPTGLSHMLYNNVNDYIEARKSLDNVIVQFIEQTKEKDYDSVLHYKNSQKMKFDRRLGLLLLHFFNHQTHHRGQITTLLNQINLDMGVTDLLIHIPEV